MKSSEEIFAQIDAADKARKELMPTELDAINMIGEAVRRLKDFGWHDEMRHCKEASFYGYEMGMRNFCVVYEIEGIDGYWSGPESYPSNPVLWKSLTSDDKGGKS